MYYYMTTARYPEHVEKTCDELPPSKKKKKTARNIFLYRWRDSFSKNHFLRTCILCKKNTRLFIRFVEKKKDTEDRPILKLESEEGIKEEDLIKQNKSIKAGQNKLQEVYHHRMIPFKEEKPTLLETGHNKLLHCGINETRFNVMRIGFYWYSCIKDIKDYIINCDSCLIRKANKIKCGVVPIVSNYPNELHVIYTMELHDFIKNRFNHKYTHLFNIIDHFSRFGFSYLIKQPNAVIISDRLRFTLTNQIPERILSDNGVEFKNNKVSVLLNSTIYNKHLDVLELKE
jgi:hypothetical protein